MQKQIIVIGMTLILLSVGLSGCTEINEENGTAKPKDTDGDGYSDNEDDFPTDPTLHLNESFSFSPTADIRVGMNVPPEGGDRNAIGISYKIESEWKYVEWKWSVQPDNVSIREWFIFQIKNPSGYTEYTGNELSSMQYHPLTTIILGIGHLFSDILEGHLLLHNIFQSMLRLRMKSTN